ncbi:hypothetical protein SUGI_1134860 [Cryptomeria japonica]|uniref:uncharacterized protein LOC131036949 n=1 Tax=Cryptomeria japonica TaxID=3369 RepID=UPI00241490EB|nr:uncharacterized protein LOC131036949 [Cryptomeria japonica]XP_057824961.2 uncharacterized protein LOC131036949 [Cryptomeria japonica]GLJ53249.1 hypothetical protein SUGI_1134860 [Cryptomeria japonica]
MITFYTPISMAKTKRRHLAAIAAKKDANAVDSKNKCSPMPRQEVDCQDEEASWVHVRKQRVIIWIPPMPKATQAPAQVQRIKQKESIPGEPAKGARKISRKRVRTDSTADTKNVGPISRKRSRIDSTTDTKNAHRNIRKAILKVTSRRRGRNLEGKGTNIEVSQNTSPLPLSRKKTAAVKAVVQGTSKIPSHSSVQQDNEPILSNRESMPRQEEPCKVLLPDSLQVPDGKVSQTVQKNQTSEISTKNKCHKRESDIDNAMKGDLDNRHKPKDQPGTGTQLIPIKDNKLFGLDRDCRNLEEAEAIRSSDVYPEEPSKPGHHLPASLIPSDSRLCDHIELQQRPLTGLDRSMAGPSVFSLKKSLEQYNLTYDARVMPSLECTSVGIFSSNTILASERISSAAVHMTIGQGNTACMTAARETNFFGSTSYVNTSVLDNQSKKMLILRKNLAKAGGLRRWLVSKGLAQFVDIFQREKVDEFRLLQLTMATLKEMGAHAVGPRRKLIHAIDCLSQPYHFGAF